MVVFVCSMAKLQLSFHWAILDLYHLPCWINYLHNCETFCVSCCRKAKTDVDNPYENDGDSEGQTNKAFEDTDDEQTGF